MAGDDLWVFGYGSLMWRPGFRHIEQVHARLRGYHRCFCIYSTHHRGRPARPGLVLGLDRGWSCEGIAYRVAAEHVAETVAYLRAREQLSGVYRETMVPVELMTEPRRETPAMTYIVERAHPSYAGRLSLARQAHLIRNAEGTSGPNLDYLVNTVRHLRALGIRERDLERLLGLIAPHAAQLSDGGLATPTARGIIRAEPRSGNRAPRMKPDQRRRFLYRMRLGS